MKKMKLHFYKLIFANQAVNLTIQSDALLFYLIIIINFTHYTNE